LTSHILHLLSLSHEHLPHLTLHSTYFHMLISSISFSPFVTTSLLHFSLKLIPYTQQHRVGGTGRNFEG